MRRMAVASMSTPVCRSVRFTLVELLTVMAIIFIMAALIVGVSSLVSRNMMEAKTKSKLEAMMIALQEYHQDRGYFPQLVSASPSTTVWVVLDLNLSDPANVGYFKHTQTGRPYLEGYAGGVYKDGWDRSFLYTIDSATVGAEGYRLKSRGQDKKTPDDPDDLGQPASTAEDDLCSWKQR